MPDNLNRFRIKIEVNRDEAKADYAAWRKWELATGEIEVSLDERNSAKDVAVFIEGLLRQKLAEVPA